MADGSIILDTRINNKGAYAELKEMQAKAKSTAQQVAALDKQLAQAGAKHTSLGDDLKRARQEAAETDLTTAQRRGLTWWQHALCIAGLLVVAYGTYRLFKHR